MMEYGTWLLLIGVCATGTFYMVRGLRDVLPDALAPEPATPRSKGLTFLVSLAVGAGLGALGLAPAVTDAPWGSAVSGLIVGAMVFGGAKIPGLQGLRLEHKGRLGKKRRVAAIKEQLDPLSQ